MKANKASCYALLVIALIFAIIGAVVMLLPEKTPPLSVSGTPIARKAGNKINIYFDLKNDNEEDLVITYLEVKD
ncbi:MAG: hypothetical protein K2N23_01720, partial [Clostridia bacterium]|nr:hypothetical protein [Clostridia bacterium]